MRVINITTNCHKDNPTDSVGLTHIIIQCSEEDPVTALTLTFASETCNMHSLSKRFVKYKELSSRPVTVLSYGVDIHHNTALSTTFHFTHNRALTHTHTHTHTHKYVYIYIYCHVMEWAGFGLVILFIELLTDPFLQVISTVSLIHSLYSLLEHTFKVFSVCCVFISLLVTASNGGSPLPLSSRSVPGLIYSKSLLTN
jgi:hypothetical protein